MGAFMPPNGFAGLAQQTPAVQALYSRGRRTMSGGRKRRRVAKSTTTSSRKRRGKKKLARLVKGSAAAKRYMAKIRRKSRRR